MGNTEQLVVLTNTPTFITNVNILLILRSRVDIFIESTLLLRVRSEGFTTNLKSCLNYQQN